ncbi:MAG: OprO/OprP family phosphate-selective porin [Acidobacteriota bacterium]
MRNALVFVFVSALLMIPGFGQAAPTEAEKKEDTSFKVQWKDGLRMENGDKSFQFQIGGRIQNDWAFMEGDEGITQRVGELEDGTEFRRARLFVSGLMYEKVEFKVQLDFATGEAVFRDVYMGITRLPAIGNIRVGQFKEPFGLEEQTSANHTTFIERSLANAFVPSRRTGLMVHNREVKERVSWALGVFKETNDFGAALGDENYAFTGRVTGLPWYENDGERILHLGFAYSRRNTSSTFRFRERPETHLAPWFVDTGVLPAEALNLAGGETALTYGPASLQGEYILANTDNGLGMDSSLKGFYLQTSFLLTGEHRTYRPAEAAFGRVRPKKSFLSKSGGIGAWEVAARFSKIDLNDGPVAGGELRDWTVGLNWYLNPNAKVMWNYVRADLDKVGTANLFQIRFHVDF